MADHSKEIAELEALINGAVDSVSTDGLSTKFNLARARQRLKELRSEDDNSKALVRPTVTGMRLGGAW